MSRLLALLKKELWQHGLVVLGLFVLLFGVGSLLLIAALVAPRTMTLLEPHASFTRFFVPIVALALGNRLVVREYAAGTQRFLEALPLRRIEVVGTKLLVGLLVLSLAALGSLSLSTLAALFRGEPLTLRWIALVALKTELFVLAVWSVLFAMGLLGRWRIPVALFFLFFLLFLDQATDAELARFGPFALIGERLVLEREALALGEVWTTLAIVLAALGLALAVSLAKEGSVAEAMARRMTSREKAAVGAVLVLALMASEVADARRDKEPFSFDRDEVVRRTDPPLEVLYLDEDNRPHAEALADRLAGDLARLREALAVDALPEVHVALRETLDPREAEVVDLEDEDGVLVRAAFTDERFDDAGLRAAVLSRVIERITDGRAAFEPHAWVRTGLSRAIVHREGRGDRELKLRALFVARDRAPSYATLERWQRTEERRGAAAAEAIAYAAMLSLRDEAGDRWLAFARAVVGSEPPAGLAAVVDARLNPVASRMEHEAGVSAPALERAWRERIAAWRRDAGGAMRAVPRVRASIAAEEGELFAIRWRVAFDRPPEPGSTCTLVHAALGPFDAPVARDELFREERACDALEPDGEALIGRYGPGERVLAAIEVHGPTLGAPVRVAASRLEVPMRAEGAR